MAQNSFLNTFVRHNTGIAAVEAVQDNLENAFAPIENCPLLSGHLLEGIELAIGDNEIDHKLTRRIVGWFITRVRSSSTYTLTGSINPTASASVTGSGTEFLTELVVGDRILVSGETRIVSAIASDTGLTVSAAFTDTDNDTAPKKYVSLSVYDNLNTSSDIDSLLNLNSNVAATVDIWVF